jgi:hypothetical protein
MAFYIESETGRKIEDLSTIDPSKFYIESGTGKQIQGTALASSQPTSQPITGADLTTQTPLNLPQQQSEPDYLAALNSTIIQSQQPLPAEKTSDDFSSQILKSIEKLGGRDVSQAAAEEKFGVTGFQKELTDVTGQIQSLQKEAFAIPLQIQQESQGRGITAGGAAPIEAGRLRENAIKALGLSAIAQTMQGNLALAQQQANRAVDLEFKPEENKLKYLQVAYVMNKDRLEREDKKRADALGILLGERTRILNEQKEKAQKVMDIRMEFALNGGDSATQSLLERETSPERALTLASRVLGEKFRQQQEEKQFTRDLQTATFSLSRDKFLQDVKQFNMQYALDQQKLDYEKWKDSHKIDPVATSEVTGEILQDKISLIDDLLKSTGLKGSVGPYPVSRFTPLSVDKAQRQEFAAGVTQLVNKETIDTLVNLKARGGALGALSDQERILLQSAATKIGSWEIKDKNNIGTGRYATNEENFKVELNRIKNLAIKAKARALGGGPIKTNTEADELRAAGYSEEQIKLLMELE